MKVKVCNLRASTFDHDFKESVMNTGFAVLTHHGIDHGIIHETQQAWRTFFNQSEEYKRSFVNHVDGNMGYKGMGTEKAVGAKVADLKEFYHWKPGQKVPHELVALTHVVFEQLEDISGQLLHIIDSSNDTKYRKACDNSDNTILRTLYYPALKDCVVEPGAVRAAAHEDINFITLLVAASAPGLQVLDKEGNWHDVPHEENSIVVNIGDMLQLASKGLYKSTTHRVVNPNGSTSDRVSMPLFVHPESSTLLADGVTAQDYLNERIAQIYGKK
jgi:isopenicillin N synthase-like dioxygenase